MPQIVVMRPRAVQPGPGSEWDLCALEYPTGREPHDRVDVVAAVDFGRPPDERAEPDPLEELRRFPVRGVRAVRRDRRAQEREEHIREAADVLRDVRLAAQQRA